MTQKLDVFIFFQLREERNEGGQNGRDISSKLVADRKIERGFGFGN